jgi:hypothetical protein
VKITVKDLIICTDSNQSGSFKSAPNVDNNLEYRGKNYSIKIIMTHENYTITVSDGSNELIKYFKNYKTDGAITFTGSDSEYKLLNNPYCIYINRRKIAYLSFKDNVYFVEIVLENKTGFELFLLGLCLILEKMLETHDGIFSRKMLPVK